MEGPPAPEQWATIELAENGPRAGADSGTPMTRHLGFPVGSTNNTKATGLWSCTPGGWPVQNRVDTETVYIISGTGTITDAADGKTHALAPGTWHTLPTGWSGRWDATSTLRKLYILTP